MLQWLMTLGHVGPFLIVAPLSTLGQWQREIEAWSGTVLARDSPLIFSADLNVIIYHGDAKTRDIIHEYEWSFARSPQVKFNALVTSYEMLLQEAARLSKVTWKYMVRIADDRRVC